MSLQIASINIHPTQKVTSTNCFMDSLVHTIIAPEFKSTDANATYGGSGGLCYSIGGPNAFAVDGDLIITASWQYGFLVTRIGDNGTITQLYRDATPCGSANMNNLAVNTTRGKAWVCSYATANKIQEYDYSAWKSGGTGPTVVGTLWTNVSAGLPWGQFGYAYFCGTYMCGDWIYLNRYNNAGAGTNVERWNPITNTFQTIAVTNASGTIYNGGFTYDAANNRLYQAGLSGSGGLYIITDPAGASPVVYRSKTDVGGLAANVYPDMYIDPDNPTQLIVWGHVTYRTGKINITVPLSGVSSTPTLIWIGAETDNNLSAFYRGYHGCTCPTDVERCLDPHVYIWE
jgi:hypothetical protein